MTFFDLYFFILYKKKQTMKTIPIPRRVLQRAFKCNMKDLDSFRRLDCWGEGSCFYHSLAMLIVQSNRVENGVGGHRELAPWPVWVIGLAWDSFRAVCGAHPGSIGRETEHRHFGHFR